jgi:hypothetical protein
LVLGKQSKEKKKKETDLMKELETIFRQTRLLIRPRRRSNPGIVA